MNPNPKTANTTSDMTGLIHDVVVALLDFSACRASHSVVGADHVSRSVSVVGGTWSCPAGMSTGTGSPCCSASARMRSARDPEGAGAALGSGVW